MRIRGKSPIGATTFIARDLNQYGGALAPATIMSTNVAAATRLFSSS
jgi:hypothetical protein